MGCVENRTIDAVISGDHEARIIVDMILLEESHAKEAMQALEEEGLVGSSLVRYFRKHYVAKHLNVEDSIRAMTHAAACSLQASKDI